MLDTVKGAIEEVLNKISHAPFQCLQLSAFLYDRLKHKHGIDCSIVAGNLQFRDTIIFKQDFSLSGFKNESLQDWAGHAWLELNGYIIDLSLFRTLYHDAFTKPCKNEMISIFGAGRGAIIASRQELQGNGLIYTPIETLTDKVAMGIISGYVNL